MAILQRLLTAVRHAFAMPVSSSAAADGELEVVDAICREIVRRQLTTPALAFLEMSRPLNYLGAQALHFFSPFLKVFTDSRGPDEFARFLERRDAIEILSSRLEALEAKSQQPQAGQATDDKGAIPR